MRSFMPTYIAFALSWIACAQQAVPGVSAAPVGPDQYILHVYENLVQVPALILRLDARPIPGLSKRQVFISLDSGQYFHPSHMHVEGNEPLALGVLIDASENQPWPNDTLIRQIGNLTIEADLRSDRFTAYAVDCKMVGALAGDGTTNPTTPAAVKSAIESNFASPALHDGKKRPACGKSLALWDAASVAVRQLSQQQGRRILLIVSEGEDHGSENSWNLLRAYAAEQGVAIFGIREVDNSENVDGTAIMTDTPVVYTGHSGGESPYVNLCVGTGGLVLQTPGNELAEALREILAMIHKRYILEFPWPSRVPEGYHTIAVKLASPYAFVATSGVTIKMPDSAKQSAPGTLPSAPSPVVLGKRRPLNSN